MLKSLSVLVTLALTMQAAGAADQTWYVSGKGDDLNPGTRAKPFATLTHAIQASRTVPNSSPRRIILDGGQYLQVSARLGAEDSGLTILARPGSEPVLVGGRQLSGFRPDGDKFWAMDLPADVSADFRLLVVNNRLAPRARHPETGTLTHLSEFKVPWMGTYGGGWKRKPSPEELTTVKVKPDDLGLHFEPMNAELTIYHEWDESMVGVKKYDATTRTLTFNTPAGHPPGAFGNQAFVLWNTRDGLTKPGQWYVDRARRKVIYWPLPTEDPSKLRAMFPTAETILHIAGSEGRPVRNLVLEGLTFTVANTPLKSGGFGAYAFPGAITAEHLENCRFTSLTIRNVAGQGINIGPASACEVTRNRIEDVGACGIIVRGRNLQISRNDIHRIGRIYPSGIGLTCNGRDNHLFGNFIHETPYVGLTCDGYRAIIESNRLEHVMQELHDGAGIYLGGTNHLIRANLCLGIGQSPVDRRHAYYMDEHVRDSRLEGNVALQCPSPLHNHMATNNVIVNNIFVHDGDLRLAFYRCADHQLERNLVCANGKIEIYRPEAVSRWTNNLFFSRTATILAYPVERYSPGPAAPLKVDGVQTGQDPRLTIVKDGKITWPKDSPASSLSIQPLDVRNAGRP